MKISASHIGLIGTCCLAVVGLLAGVSPAATPDSQTLGRGYDTQTGEYKQVWVTGTQGDDTGVISQTVYVRLIRSSSELERELNIGFAAKLKNVAYAMQAKADFARSQSLTSSSLYLLIEAKVMVTNKFFRQDAQLGSIAAGYLANGEYGVFRDLCGDCFVSGETIGRELYGILKIDNYTNQSYDKVVTSLGGRYAYFRGSADFAQSMRKITSQEAIDYHLYTFGVIRTMQHSLVATSAESLIAVVNEFLNDLGDEGGVMQSTYSPYSSVFQPGLNWQARCYLLEDKANLIRTRAVLEVLRNIYPDKGAIDDEIDRVNRLLDDVEEDLAMDTVTYDSVKYRGSLDNFVEFVENGYQQAIDAAADKVMQMPVGPLLTSRWSLTPDYSRLRVAAQNYRELAEAYYLRQNFHERVSATDRAINDARWVSFCLGASYYFDGKWAEGFAELKNAYALGLQDEELMDYIFEQGWPYGSHGDLKLSLGEERKVLAGSCMDFSSISIAKGCRLVVVGPTDPDTNLIRPHAELEVNFHHIEADDASEVLGILYDPGRYVETASDSSGSSVLGSITVLGCRGECRIDGEIVYKEINSNGIPHVGVTVPGLEVGQYLYGLGGTVYLQWEATQMRGGAGGAGGCCPQYGSEGGSGDYGYGGGGGGGGCGGGIYLARGGRGGSGGQKGGTGEKFYDVCSGVPTEGKSPDFSRWGNGGGGASEAWQYTVEHAWGGPGGNGGMRGLHGGALCLKVWGGISGSGLINVDGSSGWDGQTGGDAGRIGGNGMGGGGGGGGAGGSGGSIWLLHGTSLSSDLSITACGGNGGKGMPGGTAFYYNQPDPEEWAGVPGQDGVKGAEGQICKGDAYKLDRLPIIMTEPKSQAVKAGANVTLKITTDTVELLHSTWLKDGDILWDVPDGAMELTLVNVQESDAGSYQVIISNAAGSVASRKAQLTVQ